MCCVLRQIRASFGIALSCPVCPVCDVGVLWPDGWMDQDETRHARPCPHCVRWGPSSTSLKGAQPPKILAHICCGHMAGWIKMPLAMEVGLGVRDIVFDVDPATPIKRAHHPTKFLAHVYCGQMAGWMKTPLGTEVDLGPGHIVLDQVPAPAKGAQQSPSFRPMCIVATVAHLSYCSALVPTSI